MASSNGPQVIKGVIVYHSGFAVDADGAPKAYAPPSSGLLGLDALGNAGHPGNWWGLVTNASGAPIIQGPADPAPGYYVSTTALVDRSKAATDPRRYVDSSTVPYIVIPPELQARGLRLGDVGVAAYGGRVAGAIIADIGPHAHYGEGSIALAAALGLPTSPRNGGVGWGVSWLCFPQSARGWPRDVAAFTDDALTRFTNWGGFAELNGLFH